MAVEDDRQPRRQRLVIMLIERALTPAGMLRAQGRILVALMLHDLKTRFFGNEFGVLLVVAWPLSHILLLLVINAGLGRTAPYGESSALWFATGVIPYMAFSYMARFIMMGIVQNRSALGLPVVKVMDILFARAIIEALNASLIVGIMFIIFWTFNIDFMPRDIVQASLALLAMMLLGLSFGIINGIIAAAVPFWITGYALVMILNWAASGVLFVPDALPEIIRTPLSYLPSLQGVEWMRSAYYDGYGAVVLDKIYLVYFALVTLFVGLALERLVRGKMLGG